MKWFRIVCIFFAAFAFMVGQAEYGIALFLLIISDLLWDIAELAREILKEVDDDRGRE